MKWSSPVPSDPQSSVSSIRPESFRRVLRVFFVCVLAAYGSATCVSAQVITIDTSGKATTSTSSS